MAGLFIGIVEHGVLRLLFPPPESTTVVRLTTTSMQDSVPPENGELNLVEYEKAAIAVEGHANGDWIYSTNIVDTSEPIVTALAQQVFGH